MTATWKRGGLSAAAGLALGLALLPAQQAHAATVVPCNDIPALTDAIDEANTTGEQVVLTTGCTYTLTAPDNGENGLPVITGNVRIISNGAIIRRDPAAGDDFRIFKVESGGSLNLTRISVTGGSLAGGTGGGIHNDLGTVTLNGGTVSGNKAQSGGGIDSSGRLNLVQTVVEGNEALTGVGGGIRSILSTLTMTAGAVRDNSAQSDGGGIESAGPADITATTITDNTSGGRGGGIDSVSSIRLRVVSATVRGNKAALGGGLYNLASSANLIKTRVTGNTATGNGGGIHNESGTTNLTSTRVSGNTAANGGGIFENGGAVTLTGSAVITNIPDNCVPVGSVPGCIG